MRYSGTTVEHAARSSSVVVAAWTSVLTVASPLAAASRKLTIVARWLSVSLGARASVLRTPICTWRASIAARQRTLAASNLTEAAPEVAGWVGADVVEPSANAAVAGIAIVPAGSRFARDDRSGLLLIWCPFALRSWS